MEARQLNYQRGFKNAESHLLKQNYPYVKCEGTAVYSMLEAYTD